MNGNCDKQMHERPLNAQGEEKTRCVERGPTSPRRRIDYILNISQRKPFSSS